MKRVCSMLMAAGSLGVVLFAGGCGSDSSPAAKTATTSTPATVTAGAGGTVVTAAAVTAPTAGGVSAITIPGGTVITPSFGGTLAAGPITINVTTPTTSGSVTGMNAPTGKILVSALGAVDISITGITGFTVPAPGLTVNIPVSSCPSATGVPVLVVRHDGSSSTTTGTCSSNLVTVTGMTQFSSFLCGWVLATQ